MNHVEERFLETLRTHNIRATSARKAVFTALYNAREPLSIQSVIAAAPGADRASVYRTLSVFEELHVVSVLLVGWKKRFELAAPYKSHHHHITCSNCGKVVSIHSPSLEKLIETMARQKDFKLESHTLELKGLCKSCQTLW